MDLRLLPYRIPAPSDALLYTCAVTISCACQQRSSPRSAASGSACALPTALLYRVVAYGFTHPLTFCAGCLPLRCSLTTRDTTTPTQVCTSWFGYYAYSGRHRYRMPSTPACTCLHLLWLHTWHLVVHASLHLHACLVYAAPLLPQHTCLPYRCQDVDHSRSVLPAFCTRSSYRAFLPHPGYAAHAAAFYATALPFLHAILPVPTTRCRATRLVLHARFAYHHYTIPRYTYTCRAVVPLHYASLRTAVLYFTYFFTGSHLHYRLPLPFTCSSPATVQVMLPPLHCLHLRLTYHRCRITYIVGSPGSAVTTTPSTVPHATRTALRLAASRSTSHSAPAYAFRSTPLVATP